MWKILRERKYYGGSVREQFITNCVKIFPYEIGNKGLRIEENNMILSNSWICLVRGLLFL